MSDNHQSFLDLAASEGATSLDASVDRRALLAAGWIPPERVSDLIAAIGQIAAGDYMGVPQGCDPLGNAVRDLARTLGRANSKRLQDCVALSIKNNENLETSVGIFRDIRSIGDQSQTIAAAAEELVSSVETIAQNSTAVAEQARSALDDAKAGASQAERATECMERIASFASGAAGQVARLGDATASIGQIVSTIEEIAFHTNMIALNAAVEAARAGEAGKGFMVVADEVKRLAKQTKEATVDITHRIQSLVSDMDGIVESMKVVDSVVAEGRSAITETGRRVSVISRSTRDVTERISEVADIIHQQKTAAVDVAQGITVVAGETESIRERIAGVLGVLDETDAIVSRDLDLVAGMSLPNKVIYLAKSDHVKWKKNIAAMLVGRVRMDEGGLSDHHSCRLGRWYDQVDDPRLLAAPAFAELEGPHRTVHAVGKDIVRLYNQGDIDAAERGMARLAEASQQVLTLLDRLRVESRPRSGDA